MRKILLVFLFLILFFSLTSAEQVTLGTFVKGNNINLIQTCASCTYNNVTTIKLANGTMVTFNTAMQKDGSYYNWTLNSTYTQTLGEYIINGIGDLDGTPTIWNYNFYVTPSGSLFTNALSIPLFLPMILMLLLMFLGYFIASFVNQREYKLTFILLGTLFLVFAIAFGIIASREVLWGFPLLYNFINSFYKIFIIAISWGAIAVAMILMFYIIKTAFSTRGYYIGDTKR